MFAMPLRSADTPAHETALQLPCRDAVEQPGVDHLGVGDPPAGSGTVQPSSEGLDVGQLGHGSGPDLDLVDDVVDAKHAPGIPFGRLPLRRGGNNAVEAHNGVAHADADLRGIDVMFVV
jgi:hypothetical protein